MTEKTLKLVVPAENVKETDFNGKAMYEIDTKLKVDQFIKFLLQYAVSGDNVGIVLEDDEEAIDKERAKQLAKLSCMWARDGRGE